jgi:hypothetical protein
MCGRFLNKLPAAEIALIFATATRWPTYLEPRPYPGAGLILFAYHRANGQS